MRVRRYERVLDRDDQWADSLLPEWRIDRWMERRITGLDISNEEDDSLVQVMSLPLHDAVYLVVISQ